MKGLIMKYLSLKNILGKSLVCTVAIISLATTNVEANEKEKVKTTDSDQQYQTYRQSRTTQPSKKEITEIAKALAILRLFKKYITSFFAANNTESFIQHVENFRQVVNQIEDFTQKIEQKYNERNDEKYKQLLEIIRIIKNDVAEIYHVLTQEYRTVLTLALELSKMIKKHTNPAKVAALRQKLNELKNYFNQNEKTILENFIAVLDSVDENIPKNKITCLFRLRKVWNRK